jgi:DNA-binding IclR family transcriptional regulator
VERNILGVALQVVEYLSRAPEPVGVRELSRILDMAVASTHRVLQALKRERLVTQVGKRGLYRSGERLGQLASNLFRAHDLVPTARPFLQQMAEETGESVVVMVAEGHEAVRVASAEGSQMLRVVFSVGWRGPLYRGASGKVLLAYRSEDTIRSIIAEGVKAPPPLQLTDPQQLVARLRAIRRQGHSVSHGERQEGFTSIAAPIIGPDRKVLAAIALYGPTSRIALPRGHLQELIQLVVLYATRIGDALADRSNVGTLPRGSASGQFASSGRDGGVVRAASAP